MTIYQIVDDASRFDVRTTAFALPENGTDERAALAAAFAAYGKPQKSFQTMVMRSPPTTEVFSLLQKLGSRAKV